MDKTKLTTIILISIIVLLSFYTIFSGNRKLKEIKGLTKELAINVDSLNKVNSRYNQVLLKYDTICNQLQHTQTRFIALYKSSDSLSHATISNIEKIRITLQLIKNEHDYITKIDATPIGPVFH